MIETITVISLCILFIIFFRSGASLSVNQVIVEKPGKYRMILAPNLNLAQPFIKTLADRIETLECANRQGGAAGFFSLQDSTVIARGNGVYLLAVIYINGMLYFQAEWPLSNNPSNHLDTIKALAMDLMQDVPPIDQRSNSLQVFIGDAVQDVADEHGVNIQLLT